MAEPRQPPRSYKLDDERDFRIPELQTQRMLERGFLRIWDAVPTEEASPTIPPSEHYEHIAMSFKAHDANSALIALREFADYLFKNGFDDPDEFDRFEMAQVLSQLCEIPLGENADLAPTAFHVISVLQTRGPHYPRYLVSRDFIQWCFRFVTAGSPILYYPLTCLMNHCAHGEQATLFIQELIAPESLRGQFDATSDVLIRETILDLACRFSKVALRPEMALALIDLCRIALVLHEPSYFPSAFWILVRLLRHYAESIIYIMCPDILTNANAVLRCHDAGSLIPGMIFTSYVYELGFKYPRISIAKLLNVLSDPPSVPCQRQACRTLTKIVIRRPDMIPMLVEKGIFYHIACALDIAKIAYKVEIALLACDLIDVGGNAATARVFQTSSINLWVNFLDWDNDELTVRTLQSLDRIFESASEFPARATSRLNERFHSTGGPVAIEKLMGDENEDIAHLSTAFFEAYLAPDPDVPREEEDES
jgi:hypothetical protein